MADESKDNITFLKLHTGYSTGTRFPFPKTGVGSKTNMFVCAQVYAINLLLDQYHYKFHYHLQYQFVVEYQLHTGQAPSTKTGCP